MEGKGGGKGKERGEGMRRRERGEKDWLGGGCVIGACTTSPHKHQEKIGINHVNSQ